jgi:hypothetical protein
MHADFTAQGRPKAGYADLLVDPRVRDQVEGTAAVTLPHGNWFNPLCLCTRACAMWGFHFTSKNYLRVIP